MANAPYRVPVGHVPLGGSDFFLNLDVFKFPCNAIR